MATVTVVINGAALVLTLVLTMCDSRLPMLDHNKFAFTDLERVCHESFNSLLGAFADHGMDIGEDGITSKPAKVPASSPCYGMSSTCCLAEEEKRMQPMVEITYHKQLQSILERRLKSCNKLGRNTERLVYLSLKQSRDILERTVASMMDSPEIPKDVFDRFFKFLYRFIHVPDFCQLSDEINIQLDTLYSYVMSINSNSTLHNREDCYEDYKKHFINVWYNDTLNTFVETLNIARILSEVFQLSEKLLKDLKQHKFSQECVNSLFRLKHCSFCVGNRIDITVCDGLCLNTFRGCMVDMYSLQPHFKDLQEQLKNVMLLASTELRPDILAQRTMIGFKYIIKHLNHYTTNPANQSVDSCSIVEDKALLSQIVSDAASQPPHITYLQQSSFKEASKHEMTCYKEIASVLTELDEEICNINPKHFRYLRNKGCWNGTHSKGSYDEQIVGKSVLDQLNNPTIRRRVSMEPQQDTSGMYVRQIKQINSLIHEINKTRQFYECLEMDDEDCRMFVLECKKNIPKNHDIVVESYGSGSGSGSGHGSAGDNEHSRSSTVLIQLGGPRIFNEMMSTFEEENNEPTNVTITSHNGDDDIKYSSNNNSSDESIIYDRSVQLPVTMTTTSTESTFITTTTSLVKALPTTTPISSTPTSPPPQKHQGSSAYSVLLMSSLVVIIVTCFTTTYVIL